MDGFSIIEQLNSRQIEQLSELFKTMWWAHDRTKEEISIMLGTSISFGLIENETENLVGYARVLTDEIKYAFIFDIMTAEYLRGKGFGKLLMETIIDHPRFVAIKNFELTCAPDMMGFYERFGFSEYYGNGVRAMRLTKQLLGKGHSS